MLSQTLFFSALTPFLITAIGMLGSFSGLDELPIIIIRIFLAYCTIIAGSQTIYRLSMLLKTAGDRT